MAENPFEITAWSRTPSLYEADAGHALSEDEPAFDQLQLHSLTRGELGEKLRRRWQVFLRRFRKLKPKQVFVNDQPVWLPLLDLHVPGTGKTSVTYKRGGNAEHGAELKIFGSGFGSSITATLAETQGFSAERVGKSFQTKILATAIHYAADEGDEGDDQVRLDLELPPGAPEYRIVDLPPHSVPASLDSPQWQILQRVDLAGADQGTYVWQRDRTAEANWQVDAGIPLPEALGIKLAWTFKLTRSEAFAVKYEIPYGKEYVFYQPAGQLLLAPFCAVYSGQSRQEIELK